MKSFLVLIGMIVFSQTGVADLKLGSECGLADSWGEVQEASTTFDLSKPVEKMKGLLKGLIPVVQSQILNAAQRLDGSIRTTLDAVKELQEGSEGQELYILRAKIAGKRYSVVSYYGGGNHTGYIYPWGKTKPVAQISDGDIVCK